MNEEIFKEIARELKGLHNAAIELMKIGELDEAQKMYENAKNISEIIGYKEGIAMSMFSLSNLELVRDNEVIALDYAVLSIDYYTEESDKKNASELIKKLSLHLVKKGIELESKGEMKEALSLFSKALPNLKGKRKIAVAYEVDLLRRIIADE